MKVVRIVGGGPAGCCAALAALREGAEVRIAERSRLPRHKVCGEFLSPDIAPVLDRLGVLRPFLAARPFPVRRMVLHFGSTARSNRLPEPAYGLSRYTFDHLLWEQVPSHHHRRGFDGDPAHVIATGRRATDEFRGERLFGFKAHFEGPVDDAVELFFFDSAYVGINCVEGGITNVCGLAPEHTLKACGFQPESLFARSKALEDRVRPLNREIKWLFTGPLAFRQHWDETAGYLAGDALSFIDPFTGSGLLCAALTGSLAGTHAARRTPVAEHLRLCREAIGRPFLFSSALRRIASSAWAERLVGVVPGAWLFRATRPQSFGVL